MKRVLLVDDDALVLQMYRTGLSRLGFEVDTAQDGLEAIQRVRAQRPDLVVLDLMMPKLTGVDFLRYLRGQPDLAALPVVVLSNAYMHEMGARAAELGVQQALLKARCSPSVLAELYTRLVQENRTGGTVSPVDPSALLAVPKPSPPASAPPVAPVAPRPVERPPPKEATGAQAADFSAETRREFLRNAPQLRSEIRKLWRSLTRARTDAERRVRLDDLYRKVHFVTATAGLSRCHLVALMASAFEALLFELLGKPSALTPSVSRTIAATVDFLSLLLERVNETAPDEPLTGRVLVVDDDPVSSRLVAAALRLAQLEVRVTGQPLEALRWLSKQRFDLLLLDLALPELDGFELCQRIRALPGYARTPVIYVTAYGDFANRTRSIVTGGNDLIAKPVFPLELAVKAVLHLLRSRLLGSAVPG